jgi:predicted amidohydrolase YtcJ
MSSTQNGHIQISPLARAYLAAVRAGQVTEASPERQLMDAAHYILRYGVEGCTADVLRVVAALCEAVAELKEEREVLCRKKVLSNTDFQKTAKN